MEVQLTYHPLSRARLDLYQYSNQQWLTEKHHVDCKTIKINSSVSHLYADIIDQTWISI